MLDKQRGLVPCAHCGLRPSEIPCPLCERLICATCGEQLASCPEPWPQAFRLPRGARGLDMDRGGRRLTYVARNGTLRWLDLKGVDSQHGPNKLSDARKRLKRGDYMPWACALESGALVYLTRVSDISGFAKRLVTRVLTPTGTTHVARAGLVGHSVRPWVFASDEERYCFSVRGIHVDAIDPAADPPRFTTAFRAPWDVVVGAASDRCGVLVLGAGQTLQLFGRGSGSVELSGRLVWAGFTTEQGLLVVAADPSIEAHDRGGKLGSALRIRLLALDVEDGGAPGPDEAQRCWDAGIVLPARVLGPVHVAASVDGRLVAVRGPDASMVTLVDLVAREEQTLWPTEVWPRGEGAKPPGLLRRLFGGRGAAEVDLLRFVDDDRRLVCSLSDGRVVIWHLREGQVFVETAK
jgi:hypothetical protein